MPYKLFSQIALKEDIPKYKLHQGDIATIVERHPGAEGNEDGYSIEVFTAIGQTIAVLVVKASQIEPLNESEILHVRQLA